MPHIKFVVSTGSSNFVLNKNYCIYLRCVELSVVQFYSAHILVVLKEIVVIVFE